MKKSRIASRNLGTAATAGTADSLIVDRVRREFETFTKAEARVARTLLSDYPAAGLETVARFAKRAGTSDPTILRFIGRLGFKTYGEFQEVVRTEVLTRLQGPLARYPSRTGGGEKGDIYQRVGSALCQNIERAEKNVSREDFAEIITLICDSRRSVFCIGGRFTQMIAAFFHHYLRELRPGVRLVRDGSASWADDLLDVRRNDVLVVLDFRRYQRDVLEFSKGAVAQGGEIILITDIWNSPIAAFAKHVISCPVEVPTAFDSSVAGLAMIELIIAGAVKRLGNKARNRIGTLETLRKPFRLET